MAIGDNIIKVDISKSDERIFASSDHISVNGNRIVLHGKDMAEIPHQTQVDIVAYFEDGLQFMWGVVTLSIPKQINVEIVSQVAKKEERRQSLKVRTSFDAKAVRVYSMGRLRRSMKTDTDIKIRDLSLGGAGFFSNHPFFRKQRITLDLSFLKQGFKAEFQVLRRERVEDRTDAAGNVTGPPDFKFRYGGRVLRLTSEQERLVCEYVFKVQISEHHKRKETLSNLIV
ncbi:MAG: PilZ domain-containing protein [Clostridiales Family XIII bacterium]|jgi:hypothetical protein|nr:PilZ domain-containing protein [Clostridiales Family XIII bacterium]